MTLAMMFGIAAALVVVLWCGWAINCLGFHDWDSKRGQFTDTCKRCGAKRFK